MNSEWNVVVTKEGLPRIQTVARDGSIQSAVRSLAAWGAINVGAWFLLGAENREFLSKLTHNPSGEIIFLLYGGLILGAVMLGFAALGLTTRTSATIFLDGLSLLTVGAFNIIHDFVAIDALRPYGYTIEKSGTIWIVLGVCQVVWGFRQFSSFGRIGNWTPAILAKSEMQQTKKSLQQFVGTAEEAKDGIIKASITTKGPLGLGSLSSTTKYTGRLLEDSALMVSAKLDDCFVIDRNSMSDLSLSDSSTIAVEIEGRTKAVDVNAPSVIVLKKWAGIPVSITDIKRLETTKTASPSILKIILDTGDRKLRSAAVSALGTIKVPDAWVEHRMLIFLNDPDPEVRIFAAKYFAKFPSSKGRNALETAMERESSDKIKKELFKADYRNSTGYRLGKMWVKFQQKFH